MLDSFNIAATGLYAQQLGVDTIANNLANVNSAGYKKSRVHFEDLFYREVLRGSNQLFVSDSSTVTGGGAGVANVERVFVQGDLRTTERELDVAIQGDGFFEIVLPDGSFAYTRSGSFTLNDRGEMVTLDGHSVNPSVDFPRDVTAIQIAEDGEVSALLDNSGRPVTLGKLELARFIDPSSLRPTGNNLYVPSDESGAVIYGTPGEDGFGGLAQGFIESSNVDLVDELTSLILAQRAYELSSRVVQVSDEMMGIINDLPS
ncbi:MAG: flagellar basal-body rod protein FlgG [Pseudomonadota bacterium]